eukprot:1157629-Pelagomonas_calceolata.AAC.1
MQKDKLSEGMSQFTSTLVTCNPIGCSINIEPPRCCMLLYSRAASNHHPLFSSLDTNLDMRRTAKEKLLKLEQASVFSVAHLHCSFLAAEQQHYKSKA